MFSKLVKVLQGRKTYLVALAVAVVVFLQAIGAVSSELAQTLYGLLGAGGLATLRAGITKQ